MHTALIQDCFRSFHNSVILKEEYNRLLNSRHFILSRTSTIKLLLQLIYKVENEAIQDSERFTFNFTAYCYNSSHQVFFFRFSPTVPGKIIHAITTKQ